MISLRRLLIQIILLVVILIHAVNLKGQQAIDTSDYVPSFYLGAEDINLMIASYRGYASEIERLIKKGADINAVTDEGATPLLFAVNNNKIVSVMALISYNADVNKVTANSETPLLISVKNHNFEITEALIRAGAQLDYSDTHGATPLHYASIAGDMDIVDLLLYYGASLEIKTEEGSTPLMASIRSGYANVADLLIQNGANMETRDNDGFTPFIMAANYGDTLIMDLLYKKGVDIYATNIYNHNALTIAILAGQKDAIPFLLRIGKNWNKPGSNALNPYSVAAKYHRKDIIELLIKNNVPGQPKHVIDQVAITGSAKFSLHDAYPGISFSFKEPYINGGFIAGCDMKLWETRVLVKNTENLFYQYMDRGAVAYAGLFKDFSISDPQNKVNFAFSTSLVAGYSFGNKLKGTLIDHEKKFLAIPAISFKMTTMDLTLNIGLEYLKSEYYHIGPVWLRVGCSYNYYFDKVRSKVRTIKWY